MSAVQKLQHPEHGLQNVFNTALFLFCELWCVIIPTCFCTTVSACRVLGFLSQIHTLLRSSAQLHAAEASISKHFDGVSYVHLYSVSMCDLNLIVGANFLGFSGDCDDWNKGHKTLLTNNKEPSKLK